MAKVDTKTKKEVVDLLRQIRTTKSAKESARIADKLKEKVAAATKS